MAPDGEWYWSRRGSDGSVNRIDDRAGFWKCPYHNSRMCLEGYERLRDLTEKNKNHHIMKKTILTVMLSALAVSASAVIRPASMITDNMVLEQNANARIWGTADPGEKVTVTTSWDGKSYTTQTDRTGDWCLAVATPAGSFTPYTITIADGSEIKINNVLIGEVWLASGQSNMQMPLKGFDGCCVDGGYAEIASARNWADKVRFFTVPLTQSYEPLDTVDARWVTPSPETAPEFSAVAWHFAKQMSEVLNVPVGIVSAAYGGARVESWTPRDMLEKYPDVSLDKRISRA